MTILRSKRALGVMVLTVLGLVIIWRTVLPSGAQQQPRFVVETLLNHLRYADIGARLEPLPQGVASTSLISADRAFDIYLSSGFRPGLEASERTPILQLVSYSNDIVGAETDTGELRTPRTQNVPAWVITFPDAPMVLHGPGPQGADARPSSVARCPLLYVLNADSGSYIEAFQTCMQPETG